MDHDGGESITNSNIYIYPMKLLNKIYFFQLSIFYTTVLPTLNFFKKKLQKLHLSKESRCKVQSLASQNNADISISTLKNPYRNYCGSSFISFSNYNFLYIHQLQYLSISYIQPCHISPMLKLPVIS